MKSEDAGNKKEVIFIMFSSFIGASKENLNSCYKISMNQIDVPRYQKQNHPIFGLIPDPQALKNEKQIRPAFLRWGKQMRDKSIYFARIETFDEKQLFESFYQAIAIPFLSYQMGTVWSGEYQKIEYTPSVPHFMCGITNWHEILILTKDAGSRDQKFFERAPVIYPASFIHDYLQNRIHVQDLMHYDPKIPFEFKEFQKNTSKMIV